MRTEWEPKGKLNDGFYLWRFRMDADGHIDASFPPPTPFHGRIWTRFADSAEEANRVLEEMQGGAR